MAYHKGYPRENRSGAVEANFKFLIKSRDICKNCLNPGIFGLFQLLEHLHYEKEIQNLPRDATSLVKRMWLKSFIKECNSFFWLRCTTLSITSTFAIMSYIMLNLQWNTSNFWWRNVHKKSLKNITDQDARESKVRGMMIGYYWSALERKHVCTNNNAAMKTQFYFLYFFYFTGVICFHWIVLLTCNWLSLILQ